MARRMIRTAPVSDEGERARDARDVALFGKPRRNMSKDDLAAIIYGLHHEKIVLGLWREQETKLKGTAEEELSKTRSELRRLELLSGMLEAAAKANAATAAKLAGSLAVDTAYKVSGDYERWLCQLFAKLMASLSDDSADKDAAYEAMHRVLLALREQDGAHGRLGSAKPRVEACVLEHLSSDQREGRRRAGRELLAYLDEFTGELARRSLMDLLRRQLRSRTETDHPLAVEATDWREMRDRAISPEETG